MNKKFKTIVSFAVFAVTFLFSGLFLTNVAYATSTAETGIFTDSNNVRWEYNRAINEDREAVTIKFFDKPETMTTIVIPSLSEVLANVPNVTPTLNTYYLEDASAEYQAEHYTEVKRTSTADITKLDMSNTSKIQISGVKPMINPEIETELVFGENMVLREHAGLSIKLDICTNLVDYLDAGRYWACANFESRTIELDPYMPYWTIDRNEPSIATINTLLGRNLTLIEYQRSLGQYAVETSFVGEPKPTDKEFYRSNYYYLSTDTGAFAGYKLKLTNFDSSKFNYVGWRTFEGSTFNEENTSITISNDAFVGGEIFKDTNIKNVRIETNTTGPRLFEGCTLDDISFSNDVTEVSYQTFMNATISSGNIDFSATNITTLRGESFKNAGLTSVNLGNIENLIWRAFAENDIRDLYLPKSISWLGNEVFVNNTNLTKLTVAYDTMVPGTTNALFTVISGDISNSPIEDLTVLAPYAADEEVRPDHLTYFDYKRCYDQQQEHVADEGAWIETYYGYMGNYDGYSNHEYDAEYEYANIDSKKNVIAPLYFAFLPRLKNITVGEGYEFIGSSAFYRQSFNVNMNLIEAHTAFNAKTEYEMTVVLPDTVKGIGNLAFDGFDHYRINYNNQHIINKVNYTLPNDLEFIGIAAFRGDLSLDMDFNYPNLVFLGDLAFSNTKIRNVTLPNSLQYLGFAVFQDCFYIDDITIDFDIFSEKNVVFTDGFTSYNNYRRFNELFGDKSTYFSVVSTDDLDANEMRYEERVWYGNYYDTGRFAQKFGTITVTENATTSLPTRFYPRTNGDNSEIFGCEFKGNYFAFINADKFDMGAAGWDTLSPCMFSTSMFDEVVLPSGLAHIGYSAFNTTMIREELILPDSLITIGAAAFHGYTLNESGVDTIKITKLPTSIKMIDRFAFYYDTGFDADLDIPGLISIYAKAFARSSLKNINLSNSLSHIGEGAFGYIPTLADIYIDCDLFNVIHGMPFYAVFSTTSRDIMFQNQHAHLSKFGNITFTDKNVTAPTNGSMFYDITFETFDMSQAQWNDGESLRDELFMGIIAKEIKLPTELEIIGARAFFKAKIDEELILPETLKEIKNDAFNNADYVYTLSQSNPEGDMEAGNHIIISSLPESLEIIGDAAFYGNASLTLDLDLPNLKMIGASAFMKTGIRDVVLHDKIESIATGAFDYIPTLRNITLDCDFYGKAVGNKTFYAYFGAVDRYKYYKSQNDDRSTFGEIVFTDKNVTNPDIRSGVAFFTADKVDISNVKWTEIPHSFFYGATVTEPITISSTVKEIGEQAFQWADITLSNTFSEGLETIGKSAFYGAQVSGDITIPSTVTYIGWSAFNAGDTDTNYGTVTIKPALNYDSSDSQAVFQMFWNAQMDKLVIESPMLPVLAATGDNPVLPREIQYDITTNEGTEVITVNPTLREDGEPEFHAMTMREVEIKNLPVITANAFEECANLEQVSFVNHDSLTSIERHAFNNDTKLKKFIFGDGLEGKEVVLGTYAFNNTAIETIGGNNTDFNLAAANFDANATHVFSNLPVLKTVLVPNNFSNKTIPAYTFANDPELLEATIFWELETIDNGAFNNDTKLSKLFVWGNADVNEDVDLTIPEQTTIFAYSDAPAEAYANASSRDAYGGKFYALDEVLHLTSNKTYVVLTDDKQDFDKEGLKLYALRRDGVILESDNWQQYTTAYSRKNIPESEGSINFEEGRGALGSDEADIASQVYDAPKPFNTISLENQNYTNVNFAFIQMPSSANPLVLINYPDGYTGNIRSTTLASMTKAEEEEYLRRLEEELEVPNTGAFLEVMKVATPAVSLSTIIVAGVLVITRKRRE